MKTQITTIAAAIALTVSVGVSANQPYTPSSLFPNSSDANNTSNPRFDALETERVSMNGFNSTAGVRTSIIDQQDNNNFAEVSQGGTEQYSKVKQSGDENDAQVRQTGNSQESRIIQVGVAGGVGNTAKVSQFGGDFNDSYIYQYGDGNTADVTQNNNTNRSDSMIEQYGDGNEAKVIQRLNADETWSFISQDGEDNIADVTQYDSQLSASYIYQNGTEGHYAEVYQTGSEQTSTIRQNGGAGFADHYQAGANNVAVTTQW